MAKPQAPDLIFIHGEGVFDQSIRDQINANFTTLQGMKPMPVPAGFSGTSRGEAGQIYYDVGWLYICVAKDTWRRATLLAF